jgi:hypothetical protein
MIAPAICTVDSDLLSGSNEIWNLLALNSPWSVGLTSHLIRQSSFNSYADWSCFYENSGQNRLKLISTLSESVRYALQFCSADHAMILLGNLNKYQSLAYYYGRTEAELIHKGQILRDAFYVHEGKGMDLNTAISLVRYRVLGETWNGIYLREANTIKYIKEQYPYVQIRPVDAVSDYQFAVDYMIEYQDKLICGLQIKPLSYSSTKSYVLKAKKANEVKNMKFTALKGVPVITLLSDQNGVIKNDAMSRRLYEHLAHLYRVF